MQNHYPLWKNLLLVALVVIGLIYAIPSFFGRDPAVQISPKIGVSSLNGSTAFEVKNILNKNHIKYISAINEKDGLLVRFSSMALQQKAREDLNNALGSRYIVALNLAPKAPKWMLDLGAYPMKLGLDLQGGVHFLLSIDVNSLIKTREKADMNTMQEMLRGSNIRYSGIVAQKNNIILHFRDESSMDKAYGQLSSLSNYSLLFTLNT